jgi:hypothetical protein
MAWVPWRRRSFYFRFFIECLLLSTAVVFIVMTSPFVIYILRGILEKVGGGGPT